MNKGVNKAIIVGNVGTDAEVKYMPNGGAVMEFSVATSETWKDKASGEQKEKTEWHKVVSFGKLAENLAKHDLINKGGKVYVEGRIQTDKWQDQNGNDRYTTKINAHTIQVLESKRPGAPEIGKQYAGHKSQAYNEPEKTFDSDIPF